MRKLDLNMSILRHYAKCSKVQDHIVKELIMQKMLFLGCLLSFQIMAVYGMDKESITKVTVQEVEALVRQKEAERHQGTFGMYTASGKFIDGHVNTVHVDQDVVVKEQVIPLLIQLRLAASKEQSLGIADDELSQGITANVLALWNARKK